MTIRHASIAVFGLTFAGLVAVGAVIGFLIAPTLSELRALGEKTARAQTDLQAQYENRKKLLSSASDAEKVRKTLATLGSQFVPEGKELDFITEIEGIAGRNAVAERLRLTEASLPGAGEIRTGFELNLDGPYHKVMQTIVELERAPTLIVFTDLTVRPGASSGPDTPVSIVLHGAFARPPRGL